MLGMSINLHGFDFLNHYWVKPHRYASNDKEGYNDMNDKGRRATLFFIVPIVISFESLLA